MANLSVLQGRNGSVPIGAVVALAANLTGAHTVPATGTVDGQGWMYCDGAAIPAGCNLTGNTPNITGSRFLMGSTAAGTTGGAASVTLTTTELPAHTHSIDHDHGSVTSGGQSATHTHGQYCVQTGGGASDAPERTSSMSTANTTQFNTGNASGDHTHSVDLPNFTGTSGSTGSGTAFSILPTYITTVYLIRVR